MPPQMWDKIYAAKASRSPYYHDQQRNNPHHLVPEKKTEFYFERADTRDPRVSKLQRYAAVTSVKELLHELDKTMNYVKAHSGVELDYVQEDGEIAEEASDNNDVAPNVTYVVPCPVIHGPGLMDKVIRDIAHGESVTKRSHNTPVHSGHKVHPSKVQRTVPANTFGDMVPQTMLVHKESANNDARVIEEETPFSSVGRGKMSYDISDTLPEEEDDSNWNTKGKGKGKGKGKNKAKGKKRAQKDPAFMVIPPFGAAIAPCAIVMFTINSLKEAGNPYLVWSPAPMERSMLPGHIIMIPDDTLIAPRLRPDQGFDHDTQKMYHQALQAIHHVNTSPMNYCIEQNTHG
jgi:hypothetical protein